MNDKQIKTIFAVGVCMVIVWAIIYFARKDLHHQQAIRNAKEALEPHSTYTERYQASNVDRIAHEDFKKWLKDQTNGR